MSLFYNGSAGDGVPLDRIRQAVARHGHDLLRVVEKDTEVARLLDERPDIVAVAGGDGTVALAAHVLAVQGIPLAMLPLGTANNIARSVGVQGSIDDLVAGWDTARRLPLDLGVADGGWGRRHFVEAVGGGLMPVAISDMASRSDGDGLPAATKVAGAVRTVAEILARLEPVEWTIVADGVRMAGRFLLVEILNIRSIGPNLVVSSDADPSDGAFQVVTAGEEHRAEIARYLRCRLDGHGGSLSLPSRRAHRVTLQGDAGIHLDDEVLPGFLSRVVSIEIEAGAVDVLVAQAPSER